MNSIFFTRIAARTALACVLSLFAIQVPMIARAAPPDDIVSVSLVPGWKTDSGSYMAGLRIALAPGWKTYWRVPGDSGIPPEIAFSGSRNLESFLLHWPRPDVFDTYGLETVGYHDEVIIPVELTSRDAATPMVIAGQASIGVCQDICLPVELQFTLTIPPGAGRKVPAIMAALETVPTRARTTAPALCDAEPIRDGLRVTVRLPIPSQGGQERIFVEPGRADIWVSPSKVTRQGDTITAVADLVPPDARPFALNRSALRFTVLGDAGAVEMMGCQAD